MAGGNQTSEYKLTAGVTAAGTGLMIGNGIVAYGGWAPGWIAVAFGCTAMACVSIVIAAYALSRAKVKHAEATAEGELAIAKATADGKVQEAVAAAAPLRAAFKATSRSV